MKAKTLIAILALGFSANFALADGYKEQRPRPQRPVQAPQRQIPNDYEDYDEDTIGRGECQRDCGNPDIRPYPGQVGGMGVECATRVIPSFNPYQPGIWQIVVAATGYPLRSGNQLDGDGFQEWKRYLYETGVCAAYVN